LGGIAEPLQVNYCIGANICLGKVKDRLWRHIGFILQWALNGLRPFNAQPDITVPDPVK